MLFLKRLSDVYEDEYAATIARETRRGTPLADAQHIANDPDCKSLGLTQSRADIRRRRLIRPCAIRRFA
jgi:hypothetical protein